MVQGDKRVNNRGSYLLAVPALLIKIKVRNSSYCSQPCSLSYYYPTFNEATTAKYKASEKHKDIQREPRMGGLYITERKEGSQTLNSFHLAYSLRHGSLHSNCGQQLIYFPPAENIFTKFHRGKGIFCAMIKL